ncbi:MAG: hypothetical protein ABIE74_09915 [Pseudomonadota bacterium]
MDKHIRYLVVVFVLLIMQSSFIANLHAFELSNIWDFFSFSDEKIEETKNFEENRDIKILSDEELRVEYPGLELEKGEEVITRLLEDSSLEMATDSPNFVEGMSFVDQIQLENLEKNKPSAIETMESYSPEQLREMAIKDVQDEVTKLKSKHEYITISNEEVVLSAKNPKITFGSGDSKIHIQRESINGFDQNELIVEIEEYIMNDPLDDEEEKHLIPIGNGFYLTVRGVVHNPIHVTLTHPELTQVLTMLAKILEEENIPTKERIEKRPMIHEDSFQEIKIEERDRQSSSSSFEDLLKKLGLLQLALAQEFGDVQQDAPFPERKMDIDRQVVPGPSEVGPDRKNAEKVPIPWGDPPKQKENPRRLPNSVSDFYQTMEEYFPLSENEVGGVVYTRHRVPGEEIDFDRMGITFTIFPEPDHMNYPAYDAATIRGFVEGIGGGMRDVGVKPFMFGSRLFKSAKQWGYTNLEKLKNAFTLENADCVQLWYNYNPNTLSGMNYVGKRTKYTLYNVYYKDHPIFEVCGIHDLGQTIFGAKRVGQGKVLQGNFEYDIFSVLMKAFTYYTGADLPYHQLAANNKNPLNLNMPKLPIKIKIVPKIIRGGKEFTNVAGSLMTVNASKYWIEYKGPVLYDYYDNLVPIVAPGINQATSEYRVAGEKLMCSTIAHELMHFFDFYEMSRLMSYSAFVSLTTPSKEGIATFASEELCDESFASWPKKQGYLVDGLLSLDGIAHYKTFIQKFRWAFNIDAPPTERGYANSPYLRSILYRNNYMKEVHSGKVVDLYQYVLTKEKNKTNYQGTLEELGGLDSRRFFENLLYCKIYRSGGYDIHGNATVDSSDHYFDSFGVKRQEYETSLKLYDFYDWVRCRNIGIPNENVVNSYRTAAIGTDVVRSLNLGAELYVHGKAIYPFCIEASALIKTAANQFNKQYLVYDFRDKIVKVKIGSYEKVPIYQLACLKPLYSYRFQLKEDKKPEALDDPVMMLNLLPSSASSGTIDFLDYRSIQSDKEATLNFLFYLPKDKINYFMTKYAKNVFASLLIEFEKGPPMKLSVPMSDLPFANDMEIVSLGEIQGGKVDPNRISEWYVKELKVGMKKNTNGPTEYVVQRATLSIINGNNCIGLGENMTKWCDGSVGNSEDLTGQNTNILIGVKGKVVLEDPCPNGMARIPETGECGCKITKDGNEIGKVCKEGFTAGIVDQNTKACACLPKCFGTEHWNTEKKKCENCDPGFFNSWYAGENQGNLTECRSCHLLKHSTLQWMNTRTGKSCTSKEPTCEAFCKCPDKFEKSTDNSSCMPQCDSHEYWDASKKKCSTCKQYERPTKDHMACEACPYDKVKNERWMYFKYKTIEKKVQVFQCASVNTMCKFYEYYDLKEMACKGCPSASLGRDKDVPTHCICSDKKTLILLGQTCPDTCAPNQEYNLISKLCTTKCATGMVWNKTTGCTCPSGMKLVGTKCVVSPIACKKGEVIVKESGKDVCRWKKGTEGCVYYYYGGALKATSYRTYPNCDKGWPLVKRVPNLDFPNAPEPYGTIKIACPSGYGYIHPGYGGGDYRNACCLRDNVSTYTQPYFIYNADEYAIDACCPKGMKPVGDICK